MSDKDETVRYRKTVFNSMLVRVLMARVGEDAYTDYCGDDLLSDISNWTDEDEQRPSCPMSEGIQRLKLGENPIGLEITPDGKPVRLLVMYSEGGSFLPPSLMQFVWNDDNEISMSEVTEIRIDDLTNNIRMLRPNRDFVEQYLPWTQEAPDTRHQPVDFRVEMNADQVLEFATEHLQLRPLTSGEDRNYTLLQGYLMIVLATVGCPFEVINPHKVDPRGGVLLKVRFWTNNKVALMRNINDAINQNKMGLKLVDANLECVDDCKQYSSDDRETLVG